MSRRKITPEIADFIRANYEGATHKAMCGLIEERFGVKMSKTPVQAFYGANGLSSGLDGRYRKGHVPYTKGKKWGEYMSPEAQERSRTGQFKKGRIPWNGGAPVGTVRVRKLARGRYLTLFEKVGEPNRWRPHSRVVWERAHGPIPDGCLVAFVDGNPLNCDIGNLMLETKAQHALKSRYHVRGSDRASQEAANAWADLKMLVSRKRRKK